MGGFCTEVRQRTASSCTVDLELDGVCVQALIDTGAEASVINPQEIGDREQGKMLADRWVGHLEPTKMTVRTASGARAELGGEVKLPIRWSDQTPARVWPFLWMRSCQQGVILGIDFLQAVGAVVDAGRQELRIGNTVLRTRQYSRFDRPRRRRGPPPAEQKQAADEGECKVQAVSDPAGVGRVTPTWECACGRREACASELPDAIPAGVAAVCAKRAPPPEPLAVGDMFLWRRPDVSAGTDEFGPYRVRSYHRGGYRCLGELGEPLWAAEEAVRYYRSGIDHPRGVPTAEAVATTGPGVASAGPGQVLDAAGDGREPEDELAPLRTAGSSSAGTAASPPSTESADTDRESAPSGEMCVRTRRNRAKARRKRNAKARKKTAARGAAGASATTGPGVASAGLDRDLDDAGGPRELQSEPAPLRTAGSSSVEEKREEKKCVY